MQAESSCPLCSSVVAAGSLESHLRQHLRYAALACSLCPVEFTDDAAALAHFAGPTARHPAQPPRLLRLPEDPAKEPRLLELLRLAAGGRDAVQARLCVCGACHLLCRQLGPEGALAGAEHPVVLPAQLQPPAPEQPHPPPAPEALAKLKAEVKEHLGDVTAVPEAAAMPAEAPPQPAPQEADEATADETMVDVKPSLADLAPPSAQPSPATPKAEASADGKVACVLCGLRVTKEKFKAHAVQAHSSARPYSCLLCPQTEKTKGELAKHQKREHQAQLSPETFAFLGAEGEERELVERCFGAVGQVDYVRLRCKPCDKLIKKGNASSHVVYSHLKKALFACRLCDYANLRQDQVKFHLRKAHQRDAGPDTLDDSASRHYAPIVKSMLAQLFEKP